MKTNWRSVKKASEKPRTKGEIFTLGFIFGMTFALSILAILSFVGDK